jgi:hypothetical protein
MAGMLSYRPMLIGVAAVLANCLIWYLGVRTGPDVPDAVFAATFFAALLLPMVAGWRVSRWWLLLSLSPVILWFLEINHVC